MAARSLAAKMAVGRGRWASSRRAAGVAAFLRVGPGDDGDELSETQALHRRPRTRGAGRARPRPGRRRCGRCGGGPGRRNAGPPTSAPAWSSLVTLSTSGPRASRPTSTIGTSRLALQDHVVVEHGAAEDDAVRAQLQQRLHRVRLAGGGAVAAVHEDLVPRALRLLLDSGHDVREEGIVQVGDHHADEVGAALHEAARHRVRAIAELGRGLGHGLPAAGADVSAPLMTSETRDFDTPARRATSVIVGLPGWTLEATGTFHPKTTHSTPNIARSKGGSSFGGGQPERAVQATP